MKHLAVRKVLPFSFAPVKKSVSLSRVYFRVTLPLNMLLGLFGHRGGTKTFPDGEDHLHMLNLVSEEEVRDEISCRSKSSSFQFLTRNKNSQFQWSLYSCHFAVKCASGCFWQPRRH